MKSIRKDAKERYKDLKFLTERLILFLGTARALLTANWTLFMFWVVENTSNSPFSIGRTMQDWVSMWKWY